jgi:hypothetical protein
MTKPNADSSKGHRTEKPAVKIEVEPALKARLKAIGGSDRDQWNDRLLTLVARALPVNQKNAETVSHAGSAVMAGVVDMRPTDPIEGILISQIAVVNEAALSMYQRAWACLPDYFEAHTKYLQLADKATRTVAMLTERLDQHRGRGQQQIIVKHVTVNADQAVVTDTVVTGKPAANTPPSPDLLTTTAEKPMPMLEETAKFQPVGGGRTAK